MDMLERMKGKKAAENWEWRRTGEGWIMALGDGRPCIHLAGELKPFAIKFL